MNPHRLGFAAWIAYLLVDFGQVHQIIPGMAHISPGALATLALGGLVLIALPSAFSGGLAAPGGGTGTLIAWRALFLFAIATGLVLGVTQGRALLVLKTELPRFFCAFLGGLLFLRRISDLRAVLKALLLIDFLIAAWVLTHGGHGPGLYVDENDAGLVLVMLLPFPFLSIFAPDAPLRQRLAAAGIFALSLCAIGATLSRGAMVGCIPALVFCWLKSRHKLVGLALGAIALAVAVALAPRDFKKEFESIGDTRESTAEARRYYWDLSAQMWVHRPIFGVGAMSWGNALYSGKFAEPDRRAHMTPHSIYFQCWAELGAFGMFCWFGFLAAAFRITRSLSPRRLQAGMAWAAGADPDPIALARLRAAKDFAGPFAACLAVGMIGYLASGAFLSVLFYPGPALFAALAQAAAAAWKRELALAYAGVRETVPLPAGNPAWLGRGALPDSASAAGSASAAAAGGGAA